MSLRLLNLGAKCLQEGSVHWGVLAPACNFQQVRYRRTKHWNPKWKLFRKLKFAKVDIPNLNEKPEELSEEEMRSKFKEQGLLPPRPWLERPFHISSTAGVFEPYIPPEGDGKVSPITAQGAKQKLQYLEKKSKTMLAVRKIRSYEEEFDTPEFCKQAEEIYIKAHECMASGNLDDITEYVTEKAYPEITNNVANKTIHWKYLKNVELPRVVHARCTDMVTKENIFAQITVRLHTQQILAIYDRFGRLMHGSEILAKDVLEYVVFEKHLANEYGTWRLHEKIIPDWMPPKPAIGKTFKRLPAPVEVLEDKDKVVDKVETATTPKELAA